MGALAASSGPGTGGGEVFSSGDGGDGLGVSTDMITNYGTSP
jgi:hypothetical protein